MAADLHPIVEVQSGYLFGAVADGKWIKADEAAKTMTDETTYRVYGLTQALGEAKAGKPKPKGPAAMVTRTRAECWKCRRRRPDRHAWWPLPE